MDAYQYIEKNRRKSSKDGKLRLILLLLWLCVAVAASLLVMVIDADPAIEAKLKKAIPAIITGITVLALPFAVKGSFGSSSQEISEAFASLLNRIISKKEIIEEKNSGLLPTTASDLLKLNVANSRETAEKLFVKSGFYLFIGVVIAITGILWFYLSRNWVASGEFNANILIEIIPRAGVLLFIEFMAFFFLKQSRSVMDEYKYFDSIARHREEAFFLIEFAKESPANINPLDIAKEGWFFSKPDKLRSGETTEILENRKLEKDELATLQKIVETIKK